MKLYFFYFFYFFYEYCSRFYDASIFIYNLNTLIICNTYNTRDFNIYKTLIYTRLTIITLKIYLYNSPNRIIQNIPQNRPSKNSRKPPSQHLGHVCCKRFCSISPNRFGHFFQNIPQNRPSKNSRKPPFQHLGHVCCKRFCSISPNRFRHFSKTSPKTSYPRIRANRLSNFWAIFWKILKNRFGHFSKTSPKTGHPRIRANCFANICDLFCIFSPIYKSAA